MTTASNSTKLKATDQLDTRPGIFGRTVTSTFRKKFSFKHKPAGNIRTGWIPPIVFGSALLSIPSLLKLRCYLNKERKARLSKDPSDVRVLYYSDNLDETNGIANNLRNVIPYMRAHGMKAGLMGSAFNTRPCGVVENGYCILLPRLFSMEQLGYANSELAIPYVRQAFRLLKRYPVDIIELETPSPGAWLIALCGKIAGIKVMSHYRTDVPQYARTLVKAKWMHAFVLMLMRIFYWLARPVISPCDDYSNALIKELKVPENQVKLMPRGLPLDRFQASMRGQGTWEKFGCTREKRPVRFSFIGRISKEKNLEFLNNVWKKFAAKHDDVELMYVGYGWYLDEIKADFAKSDVKDSVSFAGEQGGEILAGLYADSDFFLFPSTTDTFGNVVVEAMSTGTPAIVSNYGGPRNIVDSEKHGKILAIDEELWLNALEECRKMKLENAEAYEQMRKDCQVRSTRYTLENSSNSQFEFFRQVAKDYYKV